MIKKVFKSFYAIKSLPHRMSKKQFSQKNFIYRLKKLWTNQNNNSIVISEKILLI